MKPNVLLSRIGGVYKVLLKFPFRALRVEIIVFRVREF